MRLLCLWNHFLRCRILQRVDGGYSASMIYSSFFFVSRAQLQASLRWNTFRSKFKQSLTPLVFQCRAKPTGTVLPPRWVINTRSFSRTQTRRVRPHDVTPVSNGTYNGNTISQSSNLHRADFLQQTSPSLPPATQGQDVTLFESWFTSK